MTMTLEKLMAELGSRPAKDPAEDLRQLREAFVTRAGRISESELATFANLTMDLLRQVPLIERMAFARQLAKHRSTPRQLLSLLTNDHYLVSAPVLESAPMLNEAELVEILATHGAPVKLAIAKRDELSVNLTDLIMADAELKVQKALAGNTGARLSRKSMTTLCDLAEADDSLRDVLVRRRDLPTAFSSRLKSIGAPAPAPVQDRRPAQKSSGPGVGRAGIVLSADLMNAKSKPKETKTFRYS